MGGGFHAESHIQNMNSGPASQTEQDFSTFSSYLGMNASTTIPTEQTNLYYDDISGSQQSSSGSSGLEIGYPTMGGVESFPDNIDTSNFGFPDDPFQSFDNTTWAETRVFDTRCCANNLSNLVSRVTYWYSECYGRTLHRHYNLPSYSLSLPEWGKHWSTEGQWW